MDRLANRLSPFAAQLAPRAHLIALALFAIVGAAVFDDYGFGTDEQYQRAIGAASFEYILGDERPIALLHPDHRIYGVGVELPLIAIERAFGLDDTRPIYLTRHLIAHALFLIGGFFAWLLAYRLFGSRLIALFAMLVFLLHPRIYAHSFFNTKDLPFLSAFMASLYLVHRAFRRDAVWAFALCGAGVALLTNIRVIGVMLIPAVLGMLALDGFHAMRRGEGGIKRALANAAAFSAAFAAALYAAWPVLWRDLSDLAAALPTLARHPALIPTLFRGEWVRWPNIPWDYIPAWALATSPPAALALAALGIAAVAWLCAADWLGALANSRARFGLLIAACLILPAAAAVALNSNIYNGWRQMYFLWAPTSVLAAFGLRTLAAIPKPPLRAGALALAALGIALIIVQMVRLHPVQSDYFSPLVDKTRLADRWTMDYWNVSHKAALERMIALQPAGRVSVRTCDPAERSLRRYFLLKNFALIPREDRARVSVNEFSPDFCLTRATVANAAWTREVYGETVLSLVDRRDAARADYAAAYAAAKSAKPDFEAHFDVYAANGMLIYLREPCAEGDELGTFTASARPVHPKQTRGYMGADGFADKHFQFRDYGERVGGACVMALKTNYPIESMKVGYRPPGSERELWSADIPVNSHIAAHEATMGGVPLARSSGYDIYADGGYLIYVKRQCAGDDIRAWFFLFISPEDPADPSRIARAGASSGRRMSSSFEFHQYGAAFDGKCVVVRELPDYPADRIETGQWLPSEGPDALWRAEFAPPGFYERRLRRAESSGEPGIRADFDVYLEGDSLLYIRKDCAASDTRGRFWLSVFPENPADLTQERRDAGFEHESLNFDFAERGAVFDGKCVIIRELPDYPIDRIETGQAVPNEGELWRGRIAGD